MSQRAVIWLLVGLGVLVLGAVAAWRLNPWARARRLARRRCRLVGHGEPVYSVDHWICPDCGQEVKAP